MSKSEPVCRLCPRLVAHREKIAQEKKAAFREEEYWGRPVPIFGPQSARLLVIGLAPGAHGANRTGRPFTGDTSGVWLYEALHEFGFATRATSTSRRDGLRLIDCRITNAVRCVPPDNRPTAAERKRCRPFLAEGIAVVQLPSVIITLGRVAFEECLKAWDGPAFAPQEPAFAHGAECRGGDTVLLASYHPSPLNTRTGRLTRGQFDAVFRRARELL